MENLEECLLYVKLTKNLGVQIIQSIHFDFLLMIEQFLRLFSRICWLPSSISICRRFFCSWQSAVDWNPSDEKTLGPKRLNERPPRSETAEAAKDEAKEAIHGAAKWRNVRNWLAKNWCCHLAEGGDKLYSTWWIIRNSKLLKCFYQFLLIIRVIHEVFVFQSNKFNYSGNS
jgi:hypothetical protein